MGRMLGSHQIGFGGATGIQRQVDGAARPTLRVGARGPMVNELQALLNSHGAAPPLAVDGVFGTMTYAAVVRFQATRSLSVDGVVGPRTWAALHGESMPAAQAPAASAGTLIGADGGAGTSAAEFISGPEAPGTVTHTSSVVIPEDCLKQRQECERCCEDLHPWWRPWEWRERDLCKYDCCGPAFRRCMVDGTFPCLCKA
ncbi:MAG TPA: peptidoglycan-binding protein [Vicinamibacterales bacterium]|nr:peptidoglycan-binding protein [Vicinamibacterales bacterium]